MAEVIYMKVNIVSAECSGAILHQNISNHNIDQLHVPYSPYQKHQS